MRHRLSPPRRAEEAGPALPGARGASPFVQDDAISDQPGQCTDHTRGATHEAFLSEARRVQPRARASGASSHSSKRSCSMSQMERANRLGVSFQQVQKYEKGVNRVGAGRLEQIAEALGVTPAFSSMAPAIA
jgi:DNA-binding transcriptional regulator YiaG